MVSKLTGTPVAFVGFAWFMKRYSIQASWSASDIAGVPFSVKSSMSLELRFPDGDWSVTVPSIIILFPCTETFGDAVTVVALSPLPKQYILLSKKLSPRTLPSAICMYIPVR